MKSNKFIYSKLICFFLLISCSYPELESDILVYENTFEDNILENIDGGEINSYNNTKVIGPFNNDGFTLHLNDIGDHDYIFISFDLYIHGSWDGNRNGFDNNDKGDIWYIKINPGMDLHNDISSNLFKTTFSNSPCFDNYCLRQSYPMTYPFENIPKKGSFQTNLPMACRSNFFGGPTTLYKIEKEFSSLGKSVVIRFYDELYQPNAIDKDGIPQQKCDESWSIDNLKVRAIKYK